MLFELTQFSDISFFLIRLVIAAIFIYHAMPKLKDAKGMAQMVGMPAGIVFMLGIVELLASLGLIVGLYTQISSLLLGVVMVGAIGMKIMKWGVPFGAMDKTGWEFDLILLAANIVIFVNGGGSIGIQ